MSTLQYRGRAPDSDFSVTPKKYIDDHYNALKVDNAYVTTAINNEVVNQGLITPAYVDAGDASVAHQTDVDTADAGYLPNTQRGVANGVATLGADVYVPAAQLPTLQTERAPYFKNVDSVFLTGTREVSQINPREYEAARLTVPDLGYLYTPLLFAVIQGGSINGANPLGRSMGTGNYAQISILHTDNSRRAVTVTSGQKGWNFFTCMPSADVLTPVSGANTFSLWLGMQTGATYTFSAAGLRFWCIAMPAL